MKPNRKIFRKLIFLFFLISTSCKSFASELNTWPDETKEVMHHSVDKTGLWILGAGVLATVTAFQFDESTRNSWRDHQLMPAETSKVGEFWGQGIPEVLIIGSQLYFEPAQGLPSAEGLLLGNLAVQVLKYSIGRERPDHSEKVSMPSGHTQSSFSLATSMTESYGWKVGLSP